MRVAIIGAGPAGALAAAKLARGGAHVRLFDPSHPREKPCGGGLTSRALALVADLIDLPALSPVVARNVALEHPSDPTVAADVELKSQGPTSESSLIVVSRAVFDRSLVDAATGAGATLVPERVVDVIRRAGGFAIRTTHGEYNADYLLGADGANSLVRKKFAAPFTRAEMSVAAGYFVGGHTSRTIAIQSTLEHPGYLWSFPRSDHLAVGACTRAERGASSTHMRQVSARWIRRCGLNGGAATMKPYAWPIPSVGFAGDGAITLRGDRWMLLGDAAGLVDPLTREGIYYALLSGQWAAEALAGGTRDALYEERVRSEIQPELARAARLSSLFFSPGFSSLLVKALRKSGPIREVFADLVAGVQPYKGLRRRLLSTWQWDVAISALGVAAFGNRRG